MKIKEQDKFTNKLKSNFPRACKIIIMMGTAWCKGFKNVHSENACSECKHSENCKLFTLTLRELCLASVDGSLLPSWYRQLIPEEYHDQFNFEKEDDLV